MPSSSIVRSKVVSVSSESLSFFGKNPNCHVLLHFRLAAHEACGSILNDRSKLLL